MNFKKLITLALAIAAIFSMSIVAYAAELTAEEEALLDKLTAGITAGDAVYTLTEGELNQIEQFLLDNEVTEEQIADIEANMESATEVIEAAGVSSLADLSVEDKNAIIGYAEAAAATVGAELVYDSSDDSVSVTVDGTEVFGSEVRADDTEDEEDVVKQTGFGLEMTAAILALIAVAILSSSVIAFRKKAQA